MSFCRRRYTADRISYLKYSQVLRESEDSETYVLEYDEWIEEHLWLFVDQYVDFAILNIIKAWRDNFISEQHCDKLIDMAEGYYFAYTEKLIDDKQLYDKITNQIMIGELHQVSWCHIGIFI